MNVTFDGTPKRYTGAYVTDAFLRILGVSPIMGRDILPEDNQPGAEKVALIGYGVWQRDFGGATDEHKRLQAPYAACSNVAGDRWVITAWERCARAWGNEPCPCLHSDPRFPDCAPGETQRLRGWLWFYEGTDIAGELRRLEATRQ